MTTTHFITCLWAWSFLLSPGMFYLFSSIAYGCWSTKKLREHLWFPQPSEMRLQESWPRSQQLSWGWSWSCPIWGSQCLLKSTFRFIFKHSKSKPTSPEIICPAKVCSDSLGVYFVEQPLGFVLKASGFESVFSSLDHLSCPSPHLHMVIRKLFKHMSIIQSVDFPWIRNCIKWEREPWRPDKVVGPRCTLFLRCVHTWDLRKISSLNVLLLCAALSSIVGDTVVPCCFLLSFWDTNTHLSPKIRIHKLLRCQRLITWQEN